MINGGLLILQTANKNRSSVQSHSGRNSVTSYYNKNGRQSIISKSPPGPTLSEAEETELEDNSTKNMDIQPSIKECPATARNDEEKVTSFTAKQDTLY